MARFAVYIPVYNGANFLDQALASIEYQTLGNVEVVVSDNASTDATPEILEKWSDRLCIRIIRRQQTMPMVEHFNALLDAVDSDAYMVLCHDDYLDSPTALEKAQAALDAHPEISAVYCDLLYVNEKRRTLARRRFSRIGPFSADDVGWQSIKTGRNCFGIPLAVRREALGGLRYDDRFRFVPDLDLSWAISRGQPAFHISEPLIANRYSGHNSTWELAANARQEYIDLSAKHGRPPGPLGRMQIAATCFGVGQKKRIFRIYERLTTWMA